MLFSVQNLAGLRILVVDDVNFSLTIVGRMVREMGCAEVFTASGGAEALGILQSSQARELDLVLLDLNMPGVDGLTILKMIRTGQTAVAKDLPVAILSGSGEEAMVRAAFGLRADAYVMKPISKAALGARLFKVLGERTMSQIAAPVPAATPGLEPEPEPELEPAAAAVAPAAEARAEERPRAASSFSSFEALCEAAILRRIDKLLAFFQRQDSAAPSATVKNFLTSTDFAERLHDVVRRLILPELWKSRQFRQQAANIALAEVDSDNFWEKADRLLIDAIQQYWNTAWDELRLVEARTEAGDRILKVKDGTKQLREMLPSDGVPYDQPKIGNREIALLRSLLDTATDWEPRLRQGWQMLSDLYRQEMEPAEGEEPAREGAFRDGLLTVSQRLPELWTDALLLACHHSFAHVTARFLDRLVTNFGIGERERMSRVPYTLRFLGQARAAA